MNQENRYHPGGQVKAPVLKFDRSRPDASRAVPRSGGLSRFSGSWNVLHSAPSRRVLSRSVANPVAAFILCSGGSVFVPLRENHDGVACSARMGLHSLLAGDLNANATGSQPALLGGLAEVPERSNGAVSKFAPARPAPSALVLERTILRTAYCEQSSHLISLSFARYQSVWVQTWVRFGGAVIRLARLRRPVSVGPRPRLWFPLARHLLRFRALRGGQTCFGEI